MTEPCTPRIASASRKGDVVCILGDGVAVMRLSAQQAIWLIARLAETLARRA